IMAEMKVRNAFIPPTALRLMRSVSDPRSKYDLVLRTIGSAGEALGRETYEWARGTLAITVNEFHFARIFVHRKPRLHPLPDV
ncbi:hypothetical protein ACEQ6A_35615, partial [Rhizobium brockwellii]